MINPRPICSGVAPPVSDAVMGAVLPFVACWELLSVVIFKMSIVLMFLSVFVEVVCSVLLAVSCLSSFVIVRFNSILNLQNAVSILEEP
eukprot:scaffold1096_cov149-Chaetoceros_neogracile.AAC.1